MATLIERFTGPYLFLDMSYPAPLVWRGIEYPTAQHAYLAGRVLDPTVRHQIASAPTTALARERAEDAVLRPNWGRTVRYNVMEEVLAQKFGDFYRRRLLVSTGHAQLVNGNVDHDTHWGYCLCPDHRGCGQNWLGRMLEALRDDLREYA